MALSIATFTTGSGKYLWAWLRIKATSHVRAIIGVGVKAAMEVLHEFRASLPPRETEGGEQQQQQQQVSWQVCENPDSGSLDELCVSGNHVIWTEGLDPSCRRVVKSYSMDGPVLQALCCSFRAGDKGLPPSSPSSSRGGRCICVREQDCLTLFMDGGDMHLVPLPFLVSLNACIILHAYVCIYAAYICTLM